VFHLEAWRTSADPERPHHAALLVARNVAIQLVAASAQPIHRQDGAIARSARPNPLSRMRV
jgi:hypothetical protein